MLLTGECNCPRVYLPAPRGDPAFGSAPCSRPAPSLPDITALQAPLALALFHPGTSLFSKATKENLEEEVGCQLCIFCLAASNGHSSAPVVTWSHH